MEKEEKQEKRPSQQQPSKKAPPKTKSVPKKTAKKKVSGKKSTQEQIFSVLKTLCIVSVILALLVIAAERFGDVTFSSVGDYFNTMISGAKSGDGYPYHFENMNVKKVQQVEKDLFVLTDNDTIVLDNTARILGQEQHSLSAPIAVTAGGRTLLVDVGEQNYRVLSRTKLLYESTFPQKLLNGAISKNGSIVLSSRGDASQTKLTVINKQQKEVFAWNCAAENILAVAISDNGRKVAASVVGAKSGELYSKVYLFDISKSNPMMSVEYDGVISGLSFLSGNRLLVTGEKVFELYDGDKKIFSEDLSVNTFSKLYLNGKKTTFAVFAKYGSASTQILKAYDKKGNLRFTTELNENVKGVSTDSLTYSVLTDNFLYTYDKEGILMGQMPVEAGCIAPFTDGKYTYIWTVSGIERYKNTIHIEGDGALENEKPETPSTS